MICYFCGTCCINLDVIIIRPDIANESFSMEDALEECFVHKPSGVICPHLEWIDKKASCRIHELSWFGLTPCHRHTQIERGDTPCRIGEYMLLGKGKEVYENMLRRAREYSV